MHQHLTFYLRVPLCPWVYVSMLSADHHWYYLSLSLPPPLPPFPSLISIHPPGPKWVMPLAQNAALLMVSLMSASCRCTSAKHESLLAAQHFVLVIMTDTPFMLLSHKRHAHKCCIISLLHTDPQMQVSQTVIITLWEGLHGTNVLKWTPDVCMQVCSLFVWF